MDQRRQSRPRCGSVIESLETRRLLSGSPVPITVAIRATDAKATESGTPSRDLAKFTISRTGDASAPLAVHIGVGGTATLGDFALSANGVAISDEVAIPAGKRSVVAFLSPVDDAVAENAETVTITLSPDAAYALAASPTAQAATATIVDNEPVFSIKRLRDAKESSDLVAGAGRFAVSRTGDLSRDVVVHYTVSGSATPDADYTALEGTVLVPAGAKSATIDVRPIVNIQTQEDVAIAVSLDPGTDYHVLAKKAAAAIKLVNANAVDWSSLVGLSNGRQYRAWASDGSGSDRGTGTINWNGSDLAESFDGAEVSTSATLSLTPAASGWALTNINVDDNPISFNSIPLFPDVLSGKISSSGTGSIDIDVPGVSLSVPVNVTVNTQLVRRNNVTVPAGTFNAYVVTTQIRMSGSGNFTVQGHSFHLSARDTETWTYYLAPGVGVVKMVLHSSASASAAGHSLGGSVSAVFDLA